MHSSPREKKETKEPDQKSDAKLEIKAAAAKSPRTLIFEHLSTFATEIKTDATELQYCFSNRDRGEEFLNWIRVQSVPEIDKAELEEREKKDGDKKEYVVRLSPQQKAAILLPPKEIASTVRLTSSEIVEVERKLREAIIANDVSAIDIIMRELSHENQLVLFPQSSGVYAQHNSLFAVIIFCSIREERNAAFYVLVSHSGSDVINKALILEERTDSEKGWTTFHQVALSEKLDIFQAMMDKASTAVIDQGLCIQSESQGVTPFVCAASSQRADVFCALINKASPAALNRTLLLHPTNGDSTFHYVASQQIGVPFIVLINKADRKVISDLLSLQNNQGNTGLHYAIRYQPSDAVALLIERATPEALNQACRMSNQYGNNILEYILSYHPPEVIAALLNKIDNQTLEIMMRAPDPPPQLLALIVNYLGHEPSWQTDSLVERFFALTGPVLAREFCKFWLAGKELPKNVMGKASLHIKFLSLMYPNAPSEYKQINQVWQQELKQTEQKEVKLDVSGIKLHSGKFIPIPSDLKDEKALTSIAQEIWKEGLASVVDYRFIRQRFPKTSIAQIANELYRAGLLFSGCYAAFRKPEPIDSKLDQIIAQGDAIHKIVRKDRWLDFFNQISDYKHRPADLRVEVDKTKIKRKHIHLKDKTVDYVYHKPGEKENKEKEDPTHTKKMSGTLLARELTTAAFGEHDINQPLVGFLFDSNKTIIKMMAKQDTGTHARGWTGSEDEVEKYVERHKEINVTDYKTFREWVNKNPKRLNELLVKLSRESALAITIVTDTEKARELARKYKHELKDQCGLDLPIFFYDRALREMRPYSLREQRDDSLKVNLLRDEHDANKRQRDEVIRRRAIHQYFSKKVEDGKYYFFTPANAKGFVDWVKVQPMSDDIGIGVYEEKQQDASIKEFNYVVQLTKNQIKELLSSEVLVANPKPLQAPDIKYLRSRLEDLFKDNKIGELDRLMRGMTESDLIEILKLSDLRTNTLSASGFNSNEPTFIVFLSYCSASVLSETALVPDKSGFTILHAAAEMLPGEGFRTLIDKLDPALISAALAMKVEHSGKTFLYFASLKQPAEEFIRLIEKASAEAINQALVLRELYWKTALHIAAEKQSSEAFRALINKASAAAINQALNETWAGGISTFECIALNQLGAPFIDFINKMDLNALRKFLPYQNDYGETGLHTVIRHQPKEAVSRLIFIATDEALNAACCLLSTQGISIFVDAFTYQPPEVMVELLNKINDEFLKFMLQAGRYSVVAVTAFIRDYLSKEPGWPMQPLVARLLKNLSGVQLAECYCQLWLSGLDLPSKVMQELKPDFDGRAHAEPKFATRVKEIQTVWEQSSAKENKEDTIHIQLGSGTTITSKDLKDEASLAKEIWERGVKSLSDFHTLKKHFPNTILSQIADELNDAGLALSGCLVPFNQFVAAPKQVAKPNTPLTIDTSPAATNQLRAKHDKIISAQTIYHYLSSAAVMVTVSPEIQQFIFSDVPRANVFVEWIKAQSPSGIQDLGVGEREQKSEGSKKEYVVQLSKKQQEELLLPVKFTQLVLTLDSDRIRIRDQLEELIKANDIRKLDKLMQEISEPDLIKIIMLYNAKHENLLHVSALHGNEATFIIFLSHCSDLTLSQTFLLKGRDDRTILYYAATNLSGEAFRMLINRVDSALIDLALFIEMTGVMEERTVLERAASRQPPDAFCALIEKASASALDQVFGKSIKSLGNISTFKMIASKQIDAPFVALLNKVDHKVISELLSSIYPHGETILHTVLLSQPKDAVLKLIALVTKESLNKAGRFTNEETKSIFNYAFSYQPPEVMVKLLNRLDDAALVYQFLSPNSGAEVVALLKDHLSKEPAWPTQPLVTRLLTRLTDLQIAECYCQLWLSGRNFPLEFMKRAKPDFVGLIAAQPVHTAEFKEIQATWGQEHKEESKDALVQVKLHLGGVLSISKDEKEFTAIAKTIWEKGLESLNELHTLKKYFSNTMLSPMVDKLYQAGLLFNGCCAPFDPPAVPLPQIDARLKIGPIFAGEDKAANELRVVHEAEAKIRAEAEAKARAEAVIQAAEDARNALIGSYIERLNGLGANTSAPESKGWMAIFQERFTGVAPAITRSAAIKMGYLIRDGKSEAFSNDELLALRSGPLGQIVAEIKKSGLLPKEFIEQEERGNVARRGFGGHR